MKKGERERERGGEERNRLIERDRIHRVRSDLGGWK